MVGGKEVVSVVTGAFVVTVVGVWPLGGLVGFGALVSGGGGSGGGSGKKTSGGNTIGGNTIGG